MANENNNNELVDSDEDPTSELEALTWQRANVVVASDTLEASAGTIDFAELSGNRLSEAGQNEALDNLAYELEQQRALRKGLEAEVEARADITNALNLRIGELERELKARTRALDKKSAAVKSLKREIRDRNQAYESAQKDLATSETSLLDTGSELASASDALRAREAEIAGVREAMAKLEGELAETRAERQALNEKLDAAIADGESLRSELDETTRILESRNDEIDRLQLVISEERESAGSTALRALLSSRERELIDRVNQYDKLQAHTDSIRQRLQDAMEENTRRGAENAALQQALTERGERVGALTTELDSARLEIAELASERDELRTRHEDEVRKLKFELGEAQVTMSQSELINEQLTSDLIQTRGFKESLEHMLEQNDENAQTRITELEQQLNKLRKDIVYFEEQLHTKNEAISCLLAELAAKQHRDGASPVDRPAASPLDEQAFQQDVDFRLPDSDRVSRFLIGDIDGKEVQFPLFKGRLTIGRAQSNDIQLTADYISRRHAVIVTEQDVTRIIDWGSRNGVRVNGEAITEHFLKTGDKVRIATFEFLYEERKRPDKT